MIDSETRASRGAGRNPGAVLSAAWLGLVGLLMVSGCGGGHRTRSSSALGDTVRVIAQGRTILVPAPEGLVDVMAAAGRSPMANQHGDVVWGAFQPRERLEEALRPGYHTDLNVMLLVRQENSGPAPVNSSTFAALCQSWRDATFPRKGPDGTRIGEALDRWRSGARDGDMGFGDLPAGDRVIVAAEHPEPDVCQLLTVGRSPSSEGGITDVWCETRILVNGQILCFYWSRAATTVGDLAEVTERSSRWAHAVHVANP